nr:Kar5 [Melampsora pruinosae]
MIERDALDRRDRAVDFSNGLDRWRSSADSILRGLAMEVDTGLSTQLVALKTELPSVIESKLNHSLQALVSCLELRFMGLAESLGQTHEESLNGIKDVILIQHGEMADLTQRLASINGGFIMIEDRLKGFDHSSNQIAFSLNQSQSTIVDVEYQIKLVMANLFKELDTQIAVMDNLTASLVGSIGIIDHTAFKSISFLFSWLKSVDGSFMRRNFVREKLDKIQEEEVEPEGCAERVSSWCCDGLRVSFCLISLASCQSSNGITRLILPPKIPPSSDDPEVSSQTMTYPSHLGASDVPQRFPGLQAQSPDVYTLQRYERVQAIACIKEFNAISTG